MGPHQIPIDGTLDLHTFRPDEARELVADYLDACREQGIYLVRIIHGKGTGSLRRLVHAVLARHPAVERFVLDENWGATVVTLHPRQDVS